MSRFGPVDPWYRKMQADLARERIERVCAAREAALRNRGATTPIVPDWFAAWRDPR